ncbi:MAG TPA: hypothetical protein VHL52_00800 [Acidimicrobiia bacterium]|nr:hypothetical protein [Acidimicrobiia bacterium]
MKPHEVVTEKTRALEQSFYGLLDSCDDYRTAIERLLAEEIDSGEPRQQLVHRLEQMSVRISTIVRILEDEALTELVPMLDRLFALERAERGEDI